MRKIGTYSLGWENVELYYETKGGSGSFMLLPNGGKPGRITVGIGETSWPDVLAILLHETFEYLATREGTRYSPSLDASQDHSNYIFLFNHPQFSEICARQAHFLSTAVPALQKVWNKHHKNRTS